MTHFLKRFGAWVIGSTDKYRFNPFVKTTVNVIALEIVLVLLNIVVFWWALGYSQSATIGAISDHITQVAHGVTTTPGALAADITHVHTQSFRYVFATLVALAGAFGFVVARFALLPTRNSLQFQKRFISNVAHEIRTPMAIIKTNTEVGLMDPNLPPDVRENYEGTIYELDRMSEILNNLLTFDNLVRPERVKSTTVDVGTIVDTVVARHADLAQSRGVTVRVKKSEHTLVHGNATALEQVFTNLVKNAINYTPKDAQGEVAISVEPNPDGSNITVTVADTGIGIAEKDLPHVFEPFYRADTSRTRGVGSSGLGLAIVNEIIRIHHGTISVRSALGHGTTIKVTLPKAKDTPETPTTQNNTHSRGILHEISIDHRPV